MSPVTRPGERVSALSLSSLCGGRPLAVRPLRLLAERPAPPARPSCPLAPSGPGAGSPHGASSGGQFCGHLRRGALRRASTPHPSVPAQLRQRALSFSPSVEAKPLRPREAAAPHSSTGGNTRACRTRAADGARGG